MVIINIINNDLLNATEKYICHQCNCTTKTSYGLSKSISKKYIWADIYKIRSKNNNTQQLDKPGTVIEIEHPVNPEKYHKVLCFMAQISPGKPNTSKKLHLNSYYDSYENRKVWFKKCLDELDNNNNYDTIAIPYGIGCGLAGGIWEEYEKMLQECKTHIVLYKFSKT